MPGDSRKPWQNHAITFGQLPARVGSCTGHTMGTREWANQNQDNKRPCDVLEGKLVHSLSRSQSEQLCRKEALQENCNMSRCFEVDMHKERTENEDTERNEGISDENRGINKIRKKVVS